MTGAHRTLQMIAFAVLVRPLTWVVLGLNVRRAELLPTRGPAVVVANHNSHLDTLVLMSLYPLRMLHRLRPVAAADYFMRWRPLAWLATRIMGVIPIERGPRGGADPLAPLVEALDRGEILILYPEGTRGEPERMADLKKGIAHLAARRRQLPVTPVFLHGLGKALPKGESVLVPFFCDVFVDVPLTWTGSRPRYMSALQARFDALAEEGEFAAWT